MTRDFISLAQLVQPKKFAANVEKQKQRHNNLVLPGLVLFGLVDGGL